MNKKINTMLFILGATLFNVFVAILSFILFLVLYARFIIPLLPENSRSWGFTLIVLASIAVSIFVYRLVLRFLLTKVDVEKYFDPIFAGKKFKRP
jgi:phosphoglycerol transferase MdoB-like AlkP superfamily enzyme